MRNAFGVLSRWLAFGSVVVAGSASTAEAMGPPSLPTTFAGEAFTVAFAFALPALLAGGYLLVRRVLGLLTLRRALVIATLTIAGAFGLAVAENRPDLLSAQALLKTAGG